MHDTRSEAQWMLKQNIRNSRERKCWSQEALAEHAGISVKHVQAIETGQRCPRVKMCEALANALGMQLFELFLPEQHGNEDEAQLLFQGLSPKEKEALLKSLKTAREVILALR